LEIRDSRFGEKVQEPGFEIRDSRLREKAFVDSRPSHRAGDPNLQSRISNLVI